MPKGDKNWLRLNVPEPEPKSEAKITAEMTGVRRGNLRLAALMGIAMSMAPVSRADRRKP